MCSINNVTIILYYGGAAVIYKAVQTAKILKKASTFASSCRKLS